MDGLRVQLERLNHRREKFHAARLRVQQRKPRVRQHDRKRYAREARAGAYVHGGGRLREAPGQRRDAVQVVAVHGLGGVVRHPGQVHAGVGFDEHAVVDFKLFRLPLAHGDAHARGALDHQFFQAIP